MTDLRTRISQLARDIREIKEIQESHEKALVVLMDEIGKIHDALRLNAEVHSQFGDVVNKVIEILVPFYPGEPPQERESGFPVRLLPGELDPRD